MKTFFKGKAVLGWGLVFLMVMTVGSCRKDFLCETCGKENRLPKAVAGADQVIWLPLDSIWLNGTGSADPDGSITAYRWREIDGPSPSAIVRPTDSVTRIRALLAGLYHFELTVTDNGGLSSMDTVRVTVNPVTVNPVTVETDSLDIYVAGDENAAPKYWKNGKGFELKISNYTIGHATAIAVDGNDVYVAGWEGDYIDMRYNRAKYWKNGQEFFLTGESGAGANDIVVSGNDVYVAGYELKGRRRVAKYWKNGVAVALTDGSKLADATGIAVVGNDVYVAGHDGDVARVWKNGRVFGPANPTNPSYAYGIFVGGSDVYLGGVMEGKAVYWKNDEVFLLTSGPGRCSSIFFSGSDVYMAGEQGDYNQSVARYWKNGREVILSGQEDITYASSIFVEGNDVYVTSYEYENNYRGGYWKNGKFVLLSPGLVQPSDIVVKRR